MIKRKDCHNRVYKKSLFLLFSILLLLPVSGFGFDIPCLHWLYGEQVEEQAPLAPIARSEPGLQFEVVLPVTSEELLEIYGHQFGMTLIALLPILDLYFGSGSLPVAMSFRWHLYPGLYLERLFQQNFYIPRAVFNYLLNNLIPELPDPESLRLNERSRSVTAIVNPAVDLSQPAQTSFYIKTISETGVFFSEADQMIDYASQLFRPESNYPQGIYSQDNRAFMGAPVKSGDYDIYQLSVINPDNATHNYDIAHKQGCHWLLGRDGVALNSQLAVSWIQDGSSALSYTPAKVPSPASAGKLSLHVPRELLSVVFNSFSSVIPKLMLFNEINGGNSAPAGMIEDSGSTRALVPKGSVQALVSPPAIFWNSPGMIQLMNKPTGDNFQFTKPAPGGSSGNGRSNGRRPQPPSNNESNDRPDDDNGDRNSSPGSLSTLSSTGNDLPLIDFIARNRITLFSANTTSKYPRRVTVSFIKLLSRAGLAQVIVKDHPECPNCPLAISKTLLRFLGSRKNVPGLPDRSEYLRGKEGSSNYYVEFDQTLYDLMLERYQEIEDLANARTEVFAAYRKRLSELTAEFNQIQLGHKFVLIGGDALSAQIGRLHEKGRLNGNYPIRDDVDVLMRMGNMEKFRNRFTYVNNYPVITPDLHSMSFPFPCLTGMCLFNIYKVKLDSVWGEFLPSLDISFPVGTVNLPTFGDSLSVLFESLSRALKFKQGDQQKYLDRMLLLRELLPEHLGAEFLYQREVRLPALTSDNERLLKALGLSNGERKKLEAEIESLQMQANARFQHMEDHDKTSLENMEDVKLEAQLEKPTEKPTKDQPEQTSIEEDDRIKLQEKIDSLNARIGKKKEKENEYTRLFQTAKDNHEEREEQVAKLNAEVTRHKKALELKEVQSEKDQLKITSLETEQAKSREKLTELEEKELKYRKQLAQHEEQQEWYRKNKQEVGEANSLLEKRLSQSHRENQRLQGEVSRYHNDRNRWIGLAMVPLGVLMLKDFLVPRFVNSTRLTCARFKRKNIKDYCLNREMNAQLLTALKVLEELPEYTRVIQFAGPEQLKGNAMNLHLPKSFITLGQLSSSQLEESLIAFNAVYHADLPLSRFASANLMLCGIMPDQKRQKACASAVAAEIEATNRWPCNSLNTANPRKNICEDLMRPGLIRKLDNQKLFALLPSWHEKKDGNFQWYAPWPVRINAKGLTKKMPGGRCSFSMTFSKYCKGGGMKIWRFDDNHWRMNYHSCKRVSVTDIGMPEAFWLQSEAGDEHDVFACDDRKFMGAVWQKD